MAKRSGIDELKLIGLMWRDSVAGSRSGISTRNITELAVDLADREGVAAVTVRRLASEAGVTAMALYPHIGGIAELRELMLDHVADATYPQTDLPRGADWPARVTAIAHANWNNCQQHPWITDAAPGRPVPGPGASAKYETELQALEGIGLTDAEMENTLTALLALTYGTARASLAAAQARVIAEQDDSTWWAGVQSALTAVGVEANRYPIATRVSRTLGEATGKANDPEAAFRRGLTLFIRGMERELECERATS